MDHTGQRFTPSKTQSPSFKSSKQKTGRKDHPARMNGRWVFWFLSYLVGGGLLAQDELQRYLGKE